MSGARTLAVFTHTSLVTRPRHARMAVGAALERRGSTRWWPIRRPFGIGRGSPENTRLAGGKKLGQFSPTCSCSVCRETSKSGPAIDSQLRALITAHGVGPSRRSENSAERSCLESTEISAGTAGLTL